MDAKLVPPDVRYKESCLAALREQEEIRESREGSTEEAALDFAGFVEKLKSQARGENLPEGFIPQTVFWLVEGDEYIGRLDIRHHLTEHLRQIGGHIGYGIRPSKRRQGYGRLILKLGLEKAKEMGIEKVLVTCDVTNVGSRKIIEANGGVMENEIQVDGSPDKARFWIQS